MSCTATLSATFPAAPRRPFPAGRKLRTALSRAAALCREIDAGEAIETTVTLLIAVGAMASIASLV